MSDYEFWKELGKIFNAVVSYQEKSIEFNKQFINPWIKIGNVFDQQDHQQEEVRAYTQATEIDPYNAQNWVDLGNAHYRNQSHDEAVIAFQKAIELDPKLGWPYSNLAVVYAEHNKHLEAKALYEKSIQLLKNDREKAISWNRLGNLHRKLNEYELAIQAFQKADELDRENTGFKDVISETSAQSKSQTDDPSQTDPIASSIQLIVAQSEPHEDTRASMENPAPVQTENILLIADPLFQPEPTYVGETVASAIPEAVSIMESTGETVSRVEATPALYIEVDATNTSVEASSSTEIESLLHQRETYSAEMTTGQQIEIKTFDSIAMVSAVQESAASTPSAQEDLPGASTNIRGAEPLEFNAPVAAEEPITEIILNAYSSDTVTEITKPITVVEEPIAETVETTNPIEIITEPFEPVAAVAIEEAASEIATTAKVSKDVVEAENHDAEVVAEETIAETNQATNPIEAVLESVEFDTVVTTEEFTAKTNETENLVEAAVEKIEPIKTIALEEPVAEEIAEFANPSEVTAEAADPITSAETELSVPDTTKEADPSEITNGIGQLAYDEFLKDESQRQSSISVQVTPETSEQETSINHKPMVSIDESGDFKLEMDTKNAHVWNELGNVYFNKGAVEDAVIAYSKAIELDRLFAWPYSNLALAYVQKGRFAEAMLLYQRSIELFTNDKDKAISWNRLGNVYRRLNDYDNAIAAYQRADELDPDNSTIYLQSRFSLLGSILMNKNVNVDL